MTHLDLFSGIGGFALAANRCGYETVAFVERDEFCKRVLRKHWPTVPIFDDIRDFDGTQFKGVRLLTGGFPCQPYSNAGLKLGSGDDRATWAEMLRVIEESRPSFVLGENVAGIVNMELDDVLASLEGAKYATQSFVIPALAVDARHRRDRVWILGADAMADPTSQRGCSRLTQREDAADVGQPSSVAGFWQWNSDADVCRTSHGLRNRAHRLRGLGNAIVPQVAEQIIRAIPQ